MDDKGVNCILMVLKKDYKDRLDFDTFVQSYMENNERNRYEKNICFNHGINFCIAGYRLCN